MNKSVTIMLCLVLIGPHTVSFAEMKPDRPQTPIMGWSSWNHFGIDINAELIKSQADHMVSSGMKDAGYTFINIDDGFFGGRDEQGNLLTHPEKFSNGMEVVSDYIHSKGLKAGIYSDAGMNTCGSVWHDNIGSGAGLYGHDIQDLNLMLDTWGFDFIKIDWCGGRRLGLDEETRYSELGTLIRAIRPDVVFNVCRWEFPGKWVVNVADSWRISGDIRNTFESILGIIDLNADLWIYAAPGHFNDMDMLQVGRGMSYDQDKAHFTMWCIMCSPLLAGNDLRDMSDQTIAILTNEEIIALNQDPLVYQARRLIDQDDLEVWAKPLISTMGGQVAVVLLNRSEKTETISFDLSTIAIRANAGYEVRDLWEKKDYPVSTEESLGFEVPPHGVVALKVTGTTWPLNVFQSLKLDEPKTGDEEGDTANEWISLFNGKDLKGWTPKIAGYELGNNFGDTFRAENGILKVVYDRYESFDRKFGHLFYEKPYSHYRLRVQYRFLGEQVPDSPEWAYRNSGLMLHCQEPGSMRIDQDFPVCIEVQLLGGDGINERSTANVCTPGTHIVMNDGLTMEHCISSESKTFHGDQWVTVEVEVRGSESIKHYVNGELVLEYEKPQFDERDDDAKKFIKDESKLVEDGYISLQAESHPTEFRKIEILPLKK